MPTLLARPPASLAPATPDVAPLSRHERRRQRRGAARADRLARRRAELVGIAQLLEDAAGVVGTGWVQGRWSSPAPRTRAGSTAPTGTAGPGDGSQETPVLSHDDPSRPAGPGGAVCLLGGLVRAAGGRTHVLDQRVQRSVDLLWETLHRPAEVLVSDGVSGSRRLLAVPAHLRQLEVWDLTRWNDTPGRTRAEVVGLLRAASARARQELVLPG